MAGVGPPPKPASRRARKNVDPIPARVFQLVRAKQPTLPDYPDHVWHAATKAWWANWGKSTLAKDFTATDWDYLIDTALMHNAMWQRAQWALAAEVRLREAKFGATPEDRARLRITLEDADAKEAAGTRRRAQPNSGGAQQPKGKSSDPRSILRAV